MTAFSIFSFSVVVLLEEEGMRVEGGGRVRGSMEGRVNEVALLPRFVYTDGSVYASPCHRAIIA